MERNGPRALFLKKANLPSSSSNVWLNKKRANLAGHTDRFTAANVLAPRMLGVSSSDRFSLMALIGHSLHTISLIPSGTGKSFGRSEELAVEIPG